MQDVSLTAEEHVEIPASAIAPAPAPPPSELLPSPPVGEPPQVGEPQAVAPPGGDSTGVLNGDDPASSVPAPTFGAGLMRFGKTLRQEAAQAAEIAAERAKAAAEHAAALSEEYKVKERVDHLRKEAGEAADSAAKHAREAAAAAAEEARKAAAAAELLLGLEHQLPGILEAHGVVLLPGQEGGAQVWEGEWEEHLRDFNRTWGSGAILLVGPQQVGDLPPAPDAAAGEVSPDTSITAGPANIESVLSTFDAEACGDDKLKKLEQTLRQVLAGAQMKPSSDQALSELTRRVVYYLTVTPGMSLVLEHAVSPPSLMQPRFVVLVGNNQVRVATYAFCGSPVKGDRPDRKYSPYALRLLSENQWRDTLGEVDGEVAPAAAPVVLPEMSTGDLQTDAPASDPPPAAPPAIDAPVDDEVGQAGGTGSVAQVEYAARFTRRTDIDAVVAEDYAALAAAVRSGDWSEVFAEPAVESLHVGQLFEAQLKSVNEGTAMLRSSVASSSFATGLGAAVGGAFDGVSLYAKDLKGPSYAEVQNRVDAFLVVETQLADETVSKGVCAALAEHGAPRAQWEATLRSMSLETLQELLLSVKQQQQEAAEQAALEPVPLAQDGEATAAMSAEAGVAAPHVGAETDPDGGAVPVVEHIGDGLAKGWRQMAAAVSDGAADLVAETKKGGTTGPDGVAAAPPVAAAKGYLKGFGKGLSRFGSKAAAGASAMAGTVADGVVATPAAVAKNAEDPDSNTAKIAASASGLGAWALAKGEAFFSDETPHQSSQQGAGAAPPTPPVGGGAPAAAAPAPVDYSQYYSPEAANVVAEVAPTTQSQAPTALGAPV